SLDHLVGALLQKPRQIKFELLRRGDIDDQQVFGSELYRKVRWFSALEDFVDVGGGAPSQVVIVGCVADETTRLDILSPSEHAGQPVLQCQFGQWNAIRAAERSRLDKDTVDAFSQSHRKRLVQILDGLHECRMHLNAEAGAGILRGLRERTVPRR